MNGEAPGCRKPPAQPLWAEPGLGVVGSGQARGAAVSRSPRDRQPFHQDGRGWTIRSPSGRAVVPFGPSRAVAVQRGSDKGKQPEPRGRCCAQKGLI